MIGIVKYATQIIKKVSTRKLSFCSDTIYSLSSGYGKSGVAVIRVSGPDSLAAIKNLTSKNFHPKPRYAYLKSFIHPSSGRVVDKGLLLWFPGPNSFTGEDSCEFQVHGGIAVVQAMLDALGSIRNVRQAKQGEFTKRSFYNGKMDLIEVEGLADIIHAETECQRQQALLQSTGVLSKLYQGWRKKLMQSIAYLEATIDFAEDHEIDGDVLVSVENTVRKVLLEIEGHLNDNRQGEILRVGVKTVIAGAPNSGKSSLLNLICQRNISIVTPIAGTTRDIIESCYSIGGYPVLFADTAGLRGETDDVIEKEGINRCIERIQYADLIILVLNATDIIQFCENGTDKSIEEYTINHLNSLGLETNLNEKKSLIMIANKLDLLNSTERNFLFPLKYIIPFSCKTNENMDRLLDVFTDKLKEICGEPTLQSPRLSKLRHRQLLTETLLASEQFLEYIGNNANADLAIAAQKLRLAVRFIAEITGNVSTEQILDIIFNDFCIGK